MRTIALIAGSVLFVLSFTATVLYAQTVDTGEVRGVINAAPSFIDQPEPVLVNESLLLLPNGLTTTYNTEALVFTIDATFDNIGDLDIANPFFRVTVLDGEGCPCEVVGFGGVGADVPVEVGSDGFWSVGEIMTKRFDIQLPSRDPFTFFVDAYGVPLP